ncbi:MAG: hypothetical protein WCO91_00410 [Gemmataceae bacterium]
MNWQGLVGHEGQKRGMERILKKGRLGQAYLFTGPSGVGKKRFAKTLCASLLCLKQGKSPELGPCGDCESCALCERDSHPDLLTVSKPEEKSEFPVKLMNEFRLLFYLKPMVSSRKVALLDDADFLNQESANSFLKTLEEPPSGMVLFLIGERTEKQLQTVLSRCQQIPFSPLSSTEMDRVIDEEVLKTPEWKWAKWASGGSIASAKAMANSPFWAIMERVLRLLGRHSKIDATLADDLVKLAESAGDTGAFQRPLVLDFLRALSRIVSHLMVPNHPGDPGEYSHQPWVNDLKQSFSRNKILRLLETLGNSGEQVERFIPLALGMAWLAEEIHQIAEL